MPLCEGQKVSKPLSRARGFLVRGFKKTAYPIELVSLINMKITPTLFEAYSGIVIPRAERAASKIGDYAWHANKPSRDRLVSLRKAEDSLSRGAV
jgi:hypothetical protein